MGFFNKQRTDGVTYDGQGAERVGIIDNVFHNLEKGCLLKRHPYDNLSTKAKVTVQEGQVMVFCSEGMYSDTFQPGRHELSTNNVPFLQNIVNLVTGGESAFKTTLFVTSTTRQRNNEWGVGLLVNDYTLGDEGTPIHVGAYGEYEFRITNAIAFIREYSGTQHEILVEDFANEFSSAVSQRVTPLISKFFSQQHTSITAVNNSLFDVAAFVKKELNLYFEEYGIEITNFDVAEIHPNEDDENYKRIMSMKTKAAEMDIESSALARKRQREGYNYQQERQFDVMQSAAQNEGSAGQMMGAGMGLGMGFGMGGAFGTQMGQMAGVMNAQPIQPQAAAVPPPPPAATTYHVLINGAQQGPYDLNTLRTLVQQGTLTPATLVWTAGMPQWDAAQNRPDLGGLFGAVPPPPPTI